MRLLYQLHHCHHYQLQPMTEMVKILVEVINQSCLTWYVLLFPVKCCLYLNNKALISLSYCSAAHHILPLSPCFALHTLHFVFNHISFHTHTPHLVFISYPGPHLSLSLFPSTLEKVEVLDSQKQLKPSFSFHQTVELRLNLISCLAIKL